MATETRNGSNVPYNEEFERLIRTIEMREPSWGAALVALAHTKGYAADNAMQRFCLAEDQYLRRSAIEAYAPVISQDKAVTLLIEALEDPSDYVVRTACDLASKLQLKQVRPKLIKVLHNCDSPTQIAALRSLEVIGSEEDFETIHEVFRQSSEKQVIRQSASTLFALVSKETWELYFDTFWNDELPRHRVWACRVFQRYGFGKQEALRTLLDDCDGHVRKAAVEVLKAKQMEPEN